MSETGALKKNACESPPFTDEVPRNKALVGNAVPTSQTPLPMFTPKKGEVDVDVAVQPIPSIVPEAVVLVAVFAMPEISEADADEIAIAEMTNAMARILMSAP